MSSKKISRHSTRTSNTSTLLSEVNKNRKKQIKNLESEIEDERRKITVLGKQQKVQEKLMETSNSADSNAAWKQYQEAVLGKNKCIKSINVCIGNIKKNKTTISKLSISLRGGGGGGKKSSRKKNAKNVYYIQSSS